MGRKIISVGQTVRSQHVIPQSYLARFADTREQIVTYMQHRKPRTGHYARECKQRDFYEYEFGAVRSDRMHDRWLESFEQAAGELYPLVEAQQKLSPVQSIHWSMFVASLFCRTRKYREQFVPHALKIANESMREEEYVESVQVRYASAGYFKTKEDIRRAVDRVSQKSPAEMVHAHLHQIEDRCVTLANLILKRTWSMVRAADGEEFPTSDAPVVSAMIDESGRVFLGHGFAKPGVCLVLPLSPLNIFVAAPANVTFPKQLNAADHHLFSRAIVQFAFKSVHSRTPKPSLQALVDSELNKMVLGETAFH